MLKHIEVSILLDIYGKLLTEKQANILDMYYNQDLSLSEIAEVVKTTRQAVVDAIKKGENKLFEYEEKLLIMKKSQDNEQTIQVILNQLSKIVDTTTDKKIDKILKYNVSKLQEWIDNKQGALAPDFAHVWLENYEKIKDEG